MTFNNIRSIDEFINKRLDNNRNASYAASFRYCLPRVPLVGDYPILIHIAVLYGKKKIALRTNHIARALKASKDYKESEGKRYWFTDIRNANKSGFDNLQLYKRALAKRSKRGSDNLGTRNKLKKSQKATETIQILN